MPCPLCDKGQCTKRCQGESGSKKEKKRKGKKGKKHKKKS